MPALTPSMVHVPRILSDFGIMRLQNEQDFVCNTVIPVKSDKQIDLYFEFDDSSLNRHEAKSRAPATKAARGGYTLGTNSFFCGRESIDTPIAMETLASTDTPLDLKKASILYINQQLLMSKELLFRDNLFTPTKWATDLLGVTSAPAAGQFIQWDQAASTPIDDIEGYLSTVKLAGTKRPNALYLNEQTFGILRNHPDVIARVSNNGKGEGARNKASKNQIAEMLGLDFVFVSGAIIETAAEGAASTNAYILGKHALLCYVDMAKTRLGQAPSAFHHFAWQNKDLGTNALGYRVRERMDESIDSIIVEGDIYSDFKVTSSKMGAFLQNVIA